jgi:methionyl-tRNA synthetase
MITSALPYANGPLHFGHLAGVYLPADIYHRHCQLSGVDSVHICGSDEHGVAITLNAEKENIAFQAYVDHWSLEHQRLFKQFEVEFTHFGRTTSLIHKKMAQDFFLRVHRAGFLEERSEQQAYCLNDQMFLPDRYLRGTCGKCGYQEARGDECPHCGAWLALGDLKDAYCAVCSKNEIETRQVKQWYFNLPRLEPKIRQWLESQTTWKENIKNYALSLLKETPERAVTRNLAWGIDLPGSFHEEGKKIYVWFEAPVGYLSNLVEFFENQGQPEAWKSYWSEPSELIHFIGKDNIIFHTIIWPATLMAAGERLPTNVPANMFLQLQKKQFSKSSGWYVDAKEALEKYGVDRLRYYLITLIPETQDTNFDWQMFHDKVNSELVNKIANLFNRVGTQIQKHFDGRIERDHFQKGPNLHEDHQLVLGDLESFRLNSALSRILDLTERANKFLDENKPWNLLKTDKSAALSILAKSCHYLFSIGALLQVFLPQYSDRILSGMGLTDPGDRAMVYQKSGAEWLRANGLKMNADASFVIPRIDQKLVDEELEKLLSRD